MTFTIWHWLVVLALVVLSILFPLVVVAIAPDDRQLDRKGFAIRLLALAGNFVMAIILVFIIINVIGLGSGAVAFALTLFLMAFVACEWLLFTFMIVWWSVQRGHALGHPRKRALRYMVPIIGLSYAVELLRATKGPDEPTGVILKG